MTTRTISLRYRLQAQIDETLARRNELFREVNAAPTWKAGTPWMRDRINAIRQLDRKLDNLAERGVEAIHA